MNTWICRILAVLFFINTLPVEAFAKKKINAPRFNQEALTQKVENAVSEENKFKQEKAELEAYLAQKDLSPRERDFANLELEIVNLNLEWINEIHHSNDNSVSTNYFSDLSTSYRTKKFEIGILCSNLFGTRDYRRHYTTDYTDIIVLNHLRPREFIWKAIFNL